MDVIRCENIGALILASRRPSSLEREKREFRQLIGRDPLTEGEILGSSPSFPIGKEGVLQMRYEGLQKEFGRDWGACQR